MDNRFEVLELFSSVESHLRGLKENLADRANPFNELYQTELTQARDLICQAIRQLAVGVK
jgi:hypothetical protein